LYSHEFGFSRPSHPVFAPEVLREGRGGGVLVVGIPEAAETSLKKKETSSVLIWLLFLFSKHRLTQPVGNLSKGKNLPRQIYDIMESHFSIRKVFTRLTCIRMEEEEKVSWDLANI